MAKSDHWGRLEEGQGFLLLSALGSVPSSSGPSTPSHHRPAVVPTGLQDSTFWRCPPSPELAVLALISGFSAGSPVSHLLCSQYSVSSSFALNVQVVFASSLDPDSYKQCHKHPNTHPRFNNHCHPAILQLFLFLWAKNPRHHDAAK